VGYYIKEGAITLYTTFKFPYENSFIEARIPTRNITSILHAKNVDGLKDEGQAITDSLRSPIGRPPLLDCIGKDDKVVVIVTDNTRPCPDDRLLPPILAEIERKIPRENIMIMVALGMHEPLDRQELIKKLGGNIVDNYSVFNHDVDDCTIIGETSIGTPVEIDNKVLAADFRISTGFIEPHIFAGFSGGRKSIAPGVFGTHSVYKNHSYRMIDHPCSRAGILKGNPIHEDMIEITRIAGLDFIVNVLLNKKREITHVVAGDFIEAHEKGCELSRQMIGVKVDRKVDIAVTTNSGAPLDLDFYQTVKGIHNAAMLTREGGIIIAVSACNTGVGPEEFRELHASFGSPQEVLQKVRRDEPIGTQWNNQCLARVQMRNDIYLASDLEDSVVREMMVTPIKTVEEGLEKALELLGDDAEIVVIPEGPLVLPLTDTPAF